LCPKEDLTSQETSTIAAFSRQICLNLSSAPVVKSIPKSDPLPAVSAHVGTQLYSYMVSIYRWNHMFLRICPETLLTPYQCNCTNIFTVYRLVWLS